MLVNIPIPVPADRDLGLFLRSEAGQGFFSGNWTWFALLVTMWVFNTVLGETAFRGLLLPRMRRACGRWDWVVNGLLFTAYHLHVPWAMPKVLLDMLIVVYPVSALPPCGTGHRSAQRPVRRLRDPRAAPRPPLRAAHPARMQPRESAGRNSPERSRPPGISRRQTLSRSLALSGGMRSCRTDSRTNDPVPWDTDLRSIG